MEKLENEGYLIVPEVLSGKELKGLLSGVSGLEEGFQSHAVRNLFDRLPGLREVLAGKGIQGLLGEAMGPGAFAVRALLFNKLPGANWRVAWHQDLTIAVKQRLETPGYGPWSIKAGIQHVQAPDSLLERMLAVRIHLDDCLESNGPLKVVPGSHRFGRLKPKEIDDRVGKVTPVLCPAPKGSVLLMRPLLLHASSSAEEPVNRRVIHVEFSSDPLPIGLEWFEKVS